MRVLLSTTSSVPIYEQIKTQARAEILSGGIEQGSTLPSLRNFAAELRVSVITVTRAYNELVAEGLVANEHGRGFVVLPVDAETAARQLDARVEAALRELHTAATHARLDIADIHRRLDETWRTRD